MPNPYTIARANGKHTAMYYDANARARSAGTYDDDARALEVAREMQTFIAQNKTGVDPRTKATITIEEYSKPWLRHHVLEPSARANYDSVLRNHILPQLGKERVAEIERQTIRHHLTKLDEAGTSAVMQKRVRDIVSAMLQTAWDDGYRSDNPARTIKGKRKIKHKKIVVLTTDQFQGVHTLIPTRGSKLFARLIVNTGMRFGEATAFMPCDIDIDRMMIHIQRAVQDCGAKYHPNGKDRFYLADYTKNGEDRWIKINKPTLKVLLDWIADNGIGDNEVIFPRHLVIGNDGRTRPRLDRPELTPEYIATLGTITAPNGRVYQHGTPNAYVIAKCRQECCRHAINEYRKALYHQHREASGRPAKTTTQPYIGRDAWGRVWHRACEGAGLSFRPTAYQLRHTHASWLIRQGVDPETVCERLGHKDLSITSRYVWAVDGGQSAADAMDDLDLDLDD